MLYTRIKRKFAETHFVNFLRNAVILCVTANFLPNCTLKPPPSASLFFFKISRSYLRKNFATKTQKSSPFSFPFLLIPSSLWENLLKIDDTHTKINKRRKLLLVNYGKKKNVNSIATFQYLFSSSFNN